MVVALGSAGLILTVGMVVLFAMFGELSGRVALAGTKTRNTEVVPLDGARLGRDPNSWPAGLTTGGEAPCVLHALVCEDGQLAASFLFHDVAALRAMTTEASAQLGLPQQDRETV